MARKKSSSKAKQAHYQSYKTEKRWEKNRLRKLDRHLSKHPNDKQALKLQGGPLNYRRKSPLSWVKKWSPVNREYSQLLRIAGCNGNDALKPREFMIMR